KSVSVTGFGGGGGGFCGPPMGAKGSAAPAASAAVKAVAQKRAAANPVFMEVPSSGVRQLMACGVGRGNRDTSSTFRSIHYTGSPPTILIFVLRSPAHLPGGTDWCFPG